jgi:hypothetical protein
MNRTPRAKPDLRLAESYIPAMMTVSKGILYTGLLCWIHKWTRGMGMMSVWATMVPIVMLYYDHLLWWSASTFIDSTSLCTDLVASTLVMQGGRLDDMGQECWFGLGVWVVGGAVHIMYASEVWKNVPNAHAVTMATWLALPAGCLLTMLKMVWKQGKWQEASNRMLMSNASAIPGEGAMEDLASPWLFLCRSIAYLLLVMVDVYTLRPPTQREKDRVSMLRYGVVLFCPMKQLLVCMVALSVAQGTKVFYLVKGQEGILTHDMPAKENGAAPKLTFGKGCHMQPHYAKATAAHDGQDAVCITNVDSLDVNEAFRLAKMQYMNGRAAV